MEQNKLKPVGELFGTIQYMSEKDVNNLIDNLDDVQSLYFITLALEISKSQNIFSFTELEIISKSLRKIKSKKLEFNDDGEDKI